MTQVSPQTDNIMILKAVDDFMKEAKGLRNKQEFLVKMAEF